MGRYDPYREGNIFERIIGFMMLATVAIAALAGLVAGVKWAWHHFFG